eukprot:COSAG06_NODE_42824_length_378_cov_0.637993_1_plen_100_part_01
MACTCLTCWLANEQGGVILLRFDNGYSWTRSKSLRLSIGTSTADGVSVAEVARGDGGVCGGGDDTTVSTKPTKCELERRIESWLSTIPIGSPGAEVCVVV